MKSASRSSAAAVTYDPYTPGEVGADPGLPGESDRRGAGAPPPGGATRAAVGKGRSVSPLSKWQYEWQAGTGQGLGDHQGVGKKVYV